MCVHNYYVKEKNSTLESISSSPALTFKRPFKAVFPFSINLMEF